MHALLLQVSPLYALQRFNALPFFQPAPPVNVEVLLAFSNNLLLGPYRPIESRQEILVVLPKRRALMTAAAGPGRVAFAKRIELTEFLLLLIQFFLRPSRHCTEAALFRFGERNDFFQPCRTFFHVTLQPWPFPMRQTIP